MIPDPEEDAWEQEAQEAAERWLEEHRKEPPSTIRELFW